MYTYTYDFGNEYESNQYTYEANKYDVAEALLEIYRKDTLELTVKNILEQIDFEKYLENNEDISCDIEEYLQEAWNGTYKDFVESFDIDFIEEQLHDELHEYFYTKAANEYNF